MLAGWCLLEICEARRSALFGMVFDFHGCLPHGGVQETTDFFPVATDCLVIGWARWRGGISPCGEELEGGKKTEPKGTRDSEHGRSP